MARAIDRSINKSISATRKHGFPALAGALLGVGLFAMAAEAVAAADTTTLTATVKRAHAAPAFSPLVSGPGESHLVRSLFPYSSLPGTRNRLLSFAHLSDLHVTDDESPLRVQYLDVYAQDHGTGSAYRAHEMLSTQLVDSLARAVRNVDAAPATGLPVQFAVVTGDATDNMQFNETRWYIDILDGNSIRPKSHSGGEESVGNRSSRKLQYWHPENFEPPIDDYKRFGFPVAGGVFASARGPFQPTGLGLPWYAAIGNHDATVQGNIPKGFLDGLIRSIPVGTLSEIATGSTRIVGVAGLPNPGDGEDYGVSDAIWDILTGDLDIETVSATADAHRIPLTKRQFIAEHFNTTGSPAGHGFSPGSSKGYYVIPTGPGDLFKFIALDSTNTNSFGSEGWIDNEQFAWLETQLKANSSRYRPSAQSASFVHQPGVQDKLFVLYSHHTLRSMDKITYYGVPKIPMGKTGDQLRDLLLRFPNVVLYVDGHTHANNITPHTVKFDDDGNQNGFWEVSTASAIDWPVQARLIEFAEDNGVLSIFTTMVDADAPLDESEGIHSPRGLAGLGRKLASNDPQEIARGIDRRRGVDSSGRNTRLLVPAPFPIKPAERDFLGWASSPHVRAVSGDFDGDTRPDIALLGGDPAWWHTLPIAHSNDAGGFRITNADTGTTFAAWAATPNVKPLVGDFNGDHRTDIALIGGDPSWRYTMPVAFSNGDGSFAITNAPIGNFNAWSATTNMKTLVADFNGDGRSDVALTGAAGWTSLPVAFSNGDGSFDIKNLSIGFFASWASMANVKVIAGDFDADGRSDIALTGGSGGGSPWAFLPVASSVGDGRFTVTTRLANAFNGWSAPANVNVVGSDFNNDGRTDLALVGVAGSIPVAYSTGGGNFTITNKPSPNFGQWAATPGVKTVSGDFDHDGMTDIALVGVASWPGIPVAYSRGSGTFYVTDTPAGPFQSLSASPGSTVLVGDYSGDGRSDMAVVGGAGVPMATSTGTGFTFSNDFGN